MKTLAVSEFKAKCIAELKTLQETGDVLIITLRGRPLARVQPIREGRRRLGLQAGSMQFHGAFPASSMEGDFGPAENKRLSRRRQ